MISIPGARFPFLLGSLVALFLLTLPRFAQQAPESQKPPAEGPAATFKSRSELVLVPVVVRDRKGKNVSGLVKDSFHLEENGKAQTISLFEEIQTPSSGPTNSSSSNLGYSNLPSDNTSQLRLTIVVIDLINTTPLERTEGRDQILRFFAKALVPNQPVSLLCLTGNGLKLVHPFTTDAEALAESLKKVSLGPRTVIPHQNAVTATIRQLKEIAQAYAGIPGRKTMIFATGYIPELATEQDMFESSVFADDLRRMWRSMVDANIAVYPIQVMNWAKDPTGLGTASAVTTRPTDLMLRQFADATGGNRCIETNGLLSCLAEAVEDSRSYYMLGFMVRPDDRKPGWRTLKVKLTAERINIRARNGFYYGGSRPDDPQSAHNEEINALASSVPFSAIPMFVKILPSLPSSGNKRTLQFMMTIPLSGVTVDPSASNALDLDIGAIALTSDTREAAESFHPVRGNPLPADLQAWEQEGIRLQEQLELPPGSYDVRFLARDNNAGRIGTVVFPLNVN